MSISSSCLIYLIVLCFITDKYITFEVSFISYIYRLRILILKGKRNFAKVSCVNRICTCCTLFSIPHIVKIYNFVTNCVSSLRPKVSADFTYYRIVCTWSCLCSKLCTLDNNLKIVINRRYSFL